MFLLPRSCRATRSAATTLLDRFGQSSRNAQGNILASPFVKSVKTISTLLQDASRLQETSVLQQQLVSLAKQRKRNGRTLLSQQLRSINIDAPREPIAGSEPGIDINNEDAWPGWRKKDVQVCITLNPELTEACSVLLFSDNLLMTL